MFVYVRVSLGYGKKWRIRSGKSNRQSNNFQTNPTFLELHQKFMSNRFAMDYTSKTSINEFIEIIVFRVKSVTVFVGRIRIVEVGFPQSARNLQ